MADSQSLPPLNEALRGAVPPPLPGGSIGSSTSRWADPVSPAPGVNAAPISAPFVPLPSASPAVATPPPLPSANALPAAPRSRGVAPRIPTAPPAAPRAVSSGPESPADTSLEEIAYHLAPPWLVSAVFHIVLFIALALWWVAPRLVGGNVDLDATFADTYADRLGVQLTDDTVLSGPDTHADAEKQILTQDGLPPVDDPFATPPAINVSVDGGVATTDLRSSVIGNALTGRQTGMKQVLLGAYGGTKLTEEVVQSGLHWLAKNQQSDGSWSLEGPYDSGASHENSEAATAMALLALQGAGNTHRSGDFKKNVQKGIAYLTKVQKADGDFYQGNRSDWFYTHGQCTIAVCELYAMTKDSELRSKAEKAVEYCVQSQDKQGGWRYRPRMDSDTSVTGWVVMGLQSARMAGVEVPQETLDRVGEYLDMAANKDGSRYGYQPGHKPDQVMTAEALLCRQYLGWSHNDPRLISGVEYLGRHLPKWEDRDVYYWYYGTQVMHHMGGKEWKQWNNSLRDMLCNHQEKNGPEKGSWNPKGESPDAWGVRDAGGRLYVTCLSLYMLEVYYRHLPIYGHATPNAL